MIVSYCVTTLPLNMETASHLLLRKHSRRVHTIGHAGVMLPVAIMPYEQEEK